MKEKNYEDNPKSIKYYVKRYLLKRKADISGMQVVDFPAGTGVTSRILLDLGAVVFPFDLFPEHFSVDRLTCRLANIQHSLPLEDRFADMIICQEGIEHFQDQLATLQEFNRILKDGGTLLLTTPNYSNLRSKMSYFLSESERFHGTMPPNELDDVWNKNDSGHKYYGHLFLIGVQKLRTLAKLSGFRIRKIHFTYSKPTSMILLCLTYPFLLLSNWVTLRKNLRKNRHDFTRRETYQEQFRLAVSWRILTGSHLMIEFEKEKSRLQLESAEMAFFSGPN